MGVLSKFLFRKIQRVDRDGIGDILVVVVETQRLLSEHCTTVPLTLIALDDSVFGKNHESEPSDF